MTLVNIPLPNEHIHLALFSTLTAAFGPEPDTKLAPSPAGTGVTVVITAVVDTITESPDVYEINEKDVEYDEVGGGLDVVGTLSRDVVEVVIEVVAGVVVVCERV